MSATDRHLALFDFDGTITTRDSLFDFLAFTFGAVRTLAGLMALGPVMAMTLIGIWPRWKGKEAVFRHFLGGWETRKFLAAAEKYARERLPSIIRDQAARRVDWHRDRGHTIYVVSASPEDWIRPWCGERGVEVIGTRLEMRDGRLTGKIDGRNCQGAEKVRRVRELIDPDAYGRVYAYGNSRGDAPMLALAHERYLNWKRIV